MRIVGVDIPDEKRVEASLMYIFGIGPSRAQAIVRSAGIEASRRTKDLTAEEVNKVKEYIEKSYRIEGDLKREIRDNIHRKKEIDAYQGARHKRGLTVRGQQTRTNSRTVRGNLRKTMGSGRKPTASKT